MTDRQTDRKTDALGKTICLPTLKGGWGRGVGGRGGGGVGGEHNFSI